MEYNLPKISVIIPTRNRPQLLERCLEALAQTDYPADKKEVIVVSDNDPESSGPAARRNQGIKQAQGEILAFTDDDCRVGTNWLKNVAAAFDSPQIGAIGGPDYSTENDQLLTRCIDYSFNSLLGTGGIRKGQGVRLAKYYPRSFNMAVSRPALDKAGGYFREGLFPGEDIELSYRIKQAGFKLAYLADNGVYHKRRTTNREFWRQIYQRGRSRIILGRIHPGLLEITHLLPLVALLGGILLLLLSFPLFIVLLLAYALLLSFTALRAAAKIRDLRCLYLIPGLIIIQHLGYAWGLLSGILNRSAFSSTQKPTGINHRGRKMVL